MTESVDSALCDSVRIVGIVIWLDLGEGCAPFDPNIVLLYWSFQKDHYLVSEVHVFVVEQEPFWWSLCEIL